MLLIPSDPLDPPFNKDADSQSETQTRTVSHPLNCISQIKSVDVQDIRQVASTNLELNHGYYQSIVKQANRSFWSALISALVGLFVFSLGATFLVFSKQDVLQISFITGFGTAITSFVSATGFYLYTRVMKYFEVFHLCLARTEIILIESSICKQIEDKTKRDTTYADIVESLEKLALHISEQKSPRAVNKNKAQTA